MNTSLFIAVVVPCAVSWFCRWPIVGACVELFVVCVCVCVCVCVSVRVWLCLVLNEQATCLPRCSMSHAATLLCMHQRVGVPHRVHATQQANKWKFHHSCAGRGAAQTDSMQQASSMPSSCMSHSSCTCVQDFSLGHITHTKKQHNNVACSVCSIQCCGSCDSFALSPSFSSSSIRNPPLPLFANLAGKHSGCHVMARISRFTASNVYLDLSLPVFRPVWLLQMRALLCLLVCLCLEHVHVDAYTIERWAASHVMEQQPAATRWTREHVCMECRSHVRQRDR